MQDSWGQLCATLHPQKARTTWKLNHNLSKYPGAGADISKHLVSCQQPEGIGIIDCLSAVKLYHKLVIISYDGGF